MIKFTVIAGLIMFIIANILSIYWMIRVYCNYASGVRYGRYHVIEKHLEKVYILFSILFVSSFATLIVGIFFRLLTSI